MARFWNAVGIFLLIFFIQNILPFSWGLVSAVTEGVQVDEDLPQVDLHDNADLMKIFEGLFVPELPELTSWGSFAEYVIWNCLGLAINCLILPVGVIGITLVYFDRRIRKEGFDIEMRVTSEPV